MKDKLRELAVKIIHDGESLPMLEISKSIYRLQKFNDGKWTSLDDDELLEILDAEGDGGAAPCEAMKLLIAIREDDYLSDSSRHRIDTLRNTHPARSGVVSDEDVETACAAYINNPYLSAREEMRISMRAALESFMENRK